MVFKILVDENIPNSVTKQLRGKDFEIVSIREEGKGIKDESVIKLSKDKQLPILTMDKDFGYLIMMNHGNGYETGYGHNQKLLVEKGQEVLKGDVIALSGNTGRSSAPHLHYEIRKDGVAIDPASYIE